MSDPIELPQAEPRPDRCETCRFRHGILRLNAEGKWHPDHRESGLTEREYESRETDPPELSGECHRYPPEVGEDGDRFYVTVALDDWCGEWQPAASPPPVPPTAGRPGYSWWVAPDVVPEKAREDWPGLGWQRWFSDVVESMLRAMPGQAGPKWARESVAQKLRYAIVRRCTLANEGRFARWTSRDEELPPDQALARLRDVDPAEVLRGLNFYEGFYEGPQPAAVRDAILAAIEGSR